MVIIEVGGCLREEEIVRMKASSKLTKIPRGFEHWKWERIESQFPLSLRVGRRILLVTLQRAGL